MSRPVAWAVLLAWVATAVGAARAPAIELGTATRVRDAVHAGACDVFGASFADWRNRRN